MAEHLSYRHHGMLTALSEDERTAVQHAFVPEGTKMNVFDYVSAPPFQLAVAGRPHGGLPAIATANTSLPFEMKLVDKELSSERLRLVYLHEQLGLEVTVGAEAIPGCAVYRSVTTARNTSDAPITLTHLSSTYQQGIAIDGIRPWYDPEKIRVHYARQTWAGEGQWRSSTLEEVGLYRNAKQFDRAAFHLSSEGSWSTGRYQPMLVLENVETSEVWYCQVETSTPWHIELGFHGSIWDQGTWAMYLQADAASVRHGGWSHELKPGESFTTAPVAVGCTTGGFDEAIRELTIYRRLRLKQAVPGFTAAPVLYNDYMNGIWARPTREKLEPIVKAAAAAGVEVFCIDAGWFASPNAKGHRILGDWHPSETKFGPEGLGGMFGFIRNQGMVPGIWMEMEVCGEDSELAGKPDDWFLRVRGQRVGGGDRWFLNFTNPAVREYLHQAIDHLVSLGAGFIKNDYNDCIGIGDDVLGSSPAAGLIRHMRGFYEFIDEVRARHPELILENCGCGAMRLDYGVQSHFHVSSYSDQESYEFAPSILTGTLAAILPEQLGIWAYPFPLIINDVDRPEVLESPEYLARMADGEQTIFNLVNGLCGLLCLAGRFDKADEKNAALIREGVEVYKQNRAFVAEAHPVWPHGHVRIGGADTWASLGHLSMSGDRMLLAVWRRETSSEFCDIPLAAFAGKSVEVTQIYPTADEYQVETNYNQAKAVLTVRFPKRNQARFFDIRLV